MGLEWRRSSRIYTPQTPRTRPIRTEPYSNQAFDGTVEIMPPTTMQVSRAYRTQAFPHVGPSYRRAQVLRLMLGVPEPRSSAEAGACIALTTPGMTSLDRRLLPRAF